MIDKNVVIDAVDTIKTFLEYSTGKESGLAIAEKEIIRFELDKIVVALNKQKDST